MRTLLSPLAIGVAVFGIGLWLSMPDIESAVRRASQGWCEATATGPNILGLNMPCLRSAIRTGPPEKSVVVRAEVQRVPYPAMVLAGDVCQAEARVADCTIRMGVLETGWRVVHTGGGCVREETRLSKWVDQVKDGYRLHLPHTVTSSREVPCSEA